MMETGVVVLPGQHFDNFLGHFWIVVEEVLDVVREQQQHVGRDLGHGLVVEPQRSQEHLNEKI